MKITYAQNTLKLPMNHKIPDAPDSYIGYEPAAWRAGYAAGHEAAVAEIKEAFLQGIASKKIGRVIDREYVDKVIKSLRKGK